MVSTRLVVQQGVCLKAGSLLKKEGINNSSFTWELGFATCVCVYTVCIYHAISICYIQLLYTLINRFDKLEVSSESFS